jgi:hypothetical protein
MVEPKVQTGVAPLQAAENENQIGAALISPARTDQKPVAPLIGSKANSTTQPHMQNSQLGRPSSEKKAN